MNTVEDEVAQIMATPWSYPGLPARDRRSLVLLFWSNFSLGVWSCWSIFRLHGQFVARRVEWARGRDRMRVKGEAPTTYGTDAPLRSEVANALLAEITGIMQRTKLRNAREIRLDGVSRHILACPGPSPDESVTWFAGSPDSLELDMWLESASVEMDNLLSASSARGGDNAV